MNRFTKITLVLVAGLVLIISLIWLGLPLIFLFGQLQMDKQMANRFKLSHQGFLRLGTIMEQENYQGEIDLKQQQAEKLLSSEKLKECQSILKKIGIPSDMSSTVKNENRISTIEIPMWTNGMFTGGISKGYFYSRKVSQSEQPDLDNLAYKWPIEAKICTKNGFCLKALDNNWYIYYSVGD